MFRNNELHTEIARAVGAVEQRGSAQTYVKKKQQMH